MMKKLIAALALAALAASVTACTGGTVPAGEDITTLRIGSSIEPTTFDPQQVNNGNEGPQFWGAVYDTVLALGPDGEIIPNLAEEWEWDAAGTTLSLTIRDDVQFTDGTPLNASAIKANLDRFLSSSNSEKAYLERVTAVEVGSDETKLLISVSEPDPGVLIGLARNNGVIGSPAAIEDPSIATEPVGSGPYVLNLEETAPGEIYIFDRNEDYWNPDRFPFDRVEISYMQDLSARMNALTTGQIDAAVIDAASQAAAEGAGMTISTGIVDWAGLILWDRDGTMVPALADVRVRQAINMAFDKQAMLDSLDYGLGQITTQVTLPGSNGYIEGIEDQYPYDPEAARALIAEAGYAEGFELSLPRLQIPSLSKYYPIVESSLAEIGITVVWDEVPATMSAIINAFYGTDYPAVVGATGGQRESWDTWVSLVSPTAPQNNLRVQNDELDALLQAAQTASESERPEANQAVSQWVVDNAWFAPFFARESVYAARPGFDVEPGFGVQAPYLAFFQKAD
jgi:peptide/nickel transport system substrate-binding protein